VLHNHVQCNHKVNTRSIICVQVDSKQWSFLTDDAKDLVTQMLEVDPSRRVTVEDALKHPWIRVSICRVDSCSFVACCVEC